MTTDNRENGHPQTRAHARSNETIFFNDDGFVPNHPRWPVILYRKAVDPSEKVDLATVLERLFAANGWGRSWRNGIYPYAHYHSAVHEVLGIARGTVDVQLGGERGRAITLRTGDVVVLPAGTGHRRLSASDDYLVVGAYPPDGDYDECTTKDDHARAVQSIVDVPRPMADPVFGLYGSLRAAWKS